VQEVYKESTPSNPDEGVNVMVCVVEVATKLYHTSFREDELEASQLAFTRPLIVAFAISPEVDTQVVFGISAIADEQLSFAGAVPLVVKVAVGEYTLVPLEQTVCT
jgi:hypothetical protein